ncbi:hypothetical protein SCAR479_04165 [Seiridium cardinale]|uniref:Uncharacterized protein n=1 Tax=Seiridium cardinale TaxID=138064 RepID=A0ABR2XZ65_9PEZI
MDCSSPTKK